MTSNEQNGTSHSQHNINRDPSSIHPNFETNNDHEIEKDCPDIVNYCERYNNDATSKIKVV
jgi:hypothetical protein